MQLPADSARRYVGDALYLAILTRTGPTRTGALLRALPPDLGFDQATARMMLEEDPRFVLRDRCWDLRIRPELGSSSFNSAVARLIADYGHPLEAGALGKAFADAAGRDVAHYETLLARLLERKEPLVAAGGSVVPREWMLFAEGEGEEDVLFYCDLDEEQLAALRPTCGDEALRGATPLDSAANIVAAAEAPIPNKLLGFFVYRLHPQEFDPEALLAAMWRDSRVLAQPGLDWAPGDLRKALRAELAKLGATAAQETSLAVDLEALLSEPLPPDHEGYYLEDADIDAVYEILNASQSPVPVAELIAEVLELSPEDARYVPAAHSIRGLLRDDPAILNLSVARFLGQGGVPGWARELPDGLLPVPGKAGEDVILQEEGLRPGLAGKVHDPYHEDVGDDDVTVGPADYTEDETYCPLAYHHRVAGTLKLRKMDGKLLGLSGSVQPVTFVGAAGGEQMAWANLELGIILGLLPIYERLELGPGALLSITPADSPGHFVLQVAGEDEATALGSGRLEELLALAQREAEPPGVFGLMQEIMSGHPKGVLFETLHAEINVVRRTSRLQVASLLSYYQCFRPMDSEGNTWAFSADAVAAGPVPTRLKHVVG